jgi:anti-anti-sigma factor
MRCEFIDSMGIDLVMRLHRAVSESRGRAALAAVAEHEQVLRMFRLTRIDELIPVFHSRQEAIEWARAQG